MNENNIRSNDVNVIKALVSLTAYATAMTSDGDRSLAIVVCADLVRNLRCEYQKLYPDLFTEEEKEERVYH